MRVLEWHVEIRQNEALGHERHHVVDARIRINVMEARPEIQAPEFAAEVEKARVNGPSARKVELVALVDAVGGRVLADDEKLLHARSLEVFRLAHDVSDRARKERAAQIRDDAEGAVMVAPLGNLEVSIVLGREPHARRRNQIVPRVVRARQHPFDHAEHFVDAVGAGHADHLRHPGENVVGAVGFLAAAQAPADDHVPVFLQRLGNRAEALLYSFIHKAAGIDDDEIGVLVGRTDAIAAGAQLRHDALRVDERLGAAE